MTSPRNIAPADGKLGVLVVGLGAVSTTLIAGVELAKRGMALPIGSLAQMGTIRLGKRTEDRSPLIRDFVPLAGLEDIVWGTWDVFPDDAYVAASRAGVLEQGKHIESISEVLRDVRPMKAAFERKYARNLDGEHVMVASGKRAMLEGIRADINKFRDENKVDRVVMIWCASTEIFIEPGKAHLDIESLEKAIDANYDTISPAMLYAYAAILEGVPFANGAPNLAVDAPALRQLATDRNVAISGKDFKTGQTLMKTVLAPMLKARMLGLSGWYSTNILGNRDGEVLDAPENFKTKEESKLGVLDTILEPSRNKELYGDIFHKVSINYYPPRG
ncbi:MAG: inositol-3-phosphate synthase, partial [Actinomycetota bacterium]